ncbi:hypothetical protein MetexDRAFT_0138 [Methylorubrum extorquens DSM 13060]|uniref:Uncharacterized protein n=1 Tax=Methylorubrum extorquens DSM 13060 TaxID=882800 RepID=H1KBX6_METEX|nr:hypothetical protein MetexDRAFT_0138 [Methylorubrum extorquens DSM 13060]
MPERAANRDISLGQPDNQPGRDKRDIPYSHVPSVPPYGRDRGDKCPECPDCPATLDPGPEIPPADRFGPWSDRIDVTERVARLRSLRAIVRLTTGPRGDRLADLLHHAEQDAAALVPALAALNHLAALDRRAVLTSFARLHRSA